MLQLPCGSMARAWESCWYWQACAQWHFKWWGINIGDGIVAEACGDTACLLYPDSLCSAGHHCALHWWSYRHPHGHNRVWTATAWPLQVSLSLLHPPLPILPCSCLVSSPFRHLSAITWGICSSAKPRPSFQKAIRNQKVSQGSDKLVGFLCMRMAKSSKLSVFTKKSPLCNTFRGVMSWFLSAQQ